MDKPQKEFRVSYHIDEFFHSFIQDATCEAEAILKTMATLPTGSFDKLSGFKIEIYKPEWN